MIELQINRDTLKADDLIKGLDDCPPDMAAAIRSYFAHFLELNADKKVACGNGHVHAGDALMDFLRCGPRFEWGLVHGSGFCTGEREGRCGWPMVAHHYVKDASGAELLTLRAFPLAVHPSLVTHEGPK